MYNNTLNRNERKLLLALEDKLLVVLTVISAKKQMHYVANSLGLFNSYSLFEHAIPNLMPI